MPRATRSSLADHSFPAFYACYLLKSIRTPKATATYVGSTPSPPRRIRQHNGEISQGAWKTKHSRPWVMQMIVHGFPSKLAALQFEWAWQHPHLSRHLRGDDGKAMFISSGKFKYLNTNVKVARSMVSSHPYNTWPLSVKLFTEEAAKIWNNATKDPSMPPLPPGLQVTTEFEGVDGKSGKTGSGRTGPIDVLDTQFTTEHLQKAAATFTPGSRLRCSICHEDIPHDAAPQDPLATALCPTTKCTAVSHLACLSRHFLSSEPSASTSDILPRGGTCTECQSYILWGDIIRGCYRRRQGGAIPENEPEELDDHEDDGHGHLFGEAEDGEELEGASRPKPAEPAAQPRTKKRPTKRGWSASTRKPASNSTAASHASSDDEREHFDLDAISSCEEESESGDNLPWARRDPAKPKPVSRSKASTSNAQPIARTIRPTAKTRPPPTGSKVQGRNGLHFLSHAQTSTATEPVVEDHDGNPMAFRALPAAGPSRFVLMSATRFHVLI
ncbi:hypothetical protein BV20DRAFT_952080 [Pilatotrama ljubarskyi]|nr:hypothetical protein BV20DRAFT_952080 [Pilatotrama ljubarskyi]